MWVESGRSLGLNGSLPRTNKSSSTIIIEARAEDVVLETGWGLPDGGSGSHLFRQGSKSMMKD